jgi:hypothetical protein
MATALALALVVSPASARADVDFIQSDSPDPVDKGATVTNTITVTNNNSFTIDPAQVELFSLAAGTASGVPNPYQSATTPSGHCIIEPTGEYQGATCDLGALGPGASGQIVAAITANASMDQVVGMVRCPSGIEAGCSAGAGGIFFERTTVIVPPEVSGSPKVKLSGLPAGCISEDLRLRAKAKGDKIKEIKAKLTGKNLRRNLGRAEGRKLSFTIAADDLEQARFYELNVNVIRKGMPGLRRTVSLQRC